MEKTFKVEYIPTIKEAGGKLNRHMGLIDELDLRQQLEALLNERHEEGYDLQQLHESQRISGLGHRQSGFFLIFKKEEEK
ncbi:MAG: hypothetical protein AAFV95_23460 [Bacteroidota bacterium]